MACKRDGIIELAEYCRTLGINVNIGVNKARGNRGFFKVKGDNFRIDISKGQSEDIIIKTLCHEFMHFIHYMFDKNLKDLSFILGEINCGIEAELLELTVESIPKSEIAPLFNLKTKLSKEISEYKDNIKKKVPDFKLTSPCKKIEEEISSIPLKYLLKYDRVKIFSDKLYSVENIETDFPRLPPEVVSYIKLMSKKRALKKINAKIARLNKYYNMNSELLARAFQYYITDNNIVKAKAPKVAKCFEETIKNNKIPYLTDFVNKVYKIL